MTMPSGAVPCSRVAWKNPAHPEDPLALGKTRILPLKQAPYSACRRSMIVPFAGSIPPHPEIGSGETSASPSATPGTTIRPRKISLVLAVSAGGGGKDGGLLGAALLSTCP